MNGLTRAIKVSVLGRNGLETKEVCLEEAEKILKESYADPMGGLVYDGRTGEVIGEIGPNVREIVIIDHMIGGG
jgi:hypothetical protein